MQQAPPAVAIRSHWQLGQLASSQGQPEPGHKKFHNGPNSVPISNGSMRYSISFSPPFLRRKQLLLRDSRKSAQFICVFLKLQIDVIKSFLHCSFSYKTASSVFVYPGATTSAHTKRKPFTIGAHFMLKMIYGSPFF